MKCMYSVKHECEVKNICFYRTSSLVLVQVQVLVLDLSGPTSLWFGLVTFFTRLGPCAAFALLFFLFISYKPQPQKKRT